MNAQALTGTSVLIVTEASVIERGRVILPTVIVNAVTETTVNTGKNAALKSLLLLEAILGNLIPLDPLLIVTSLLEKGGAAVLHALVRP